MDRLSNAIVLCLLAGVFGPYAAVAHAQGNGYRIGINDVLVLSIYAGGEKQSEMTLTVSAKGTVNAPFVGETQAAGMTADRLAERIRKPLAEDYFVNPAVNIQIEAHRSQYYYISGAVKSPGLYYLANEASLLVLIAEAGGVLPERGNQAHIMKGAAREVAAGKKAAVPEVGEDVVKVDLYRLLEKGDLSVNPSLSPGDVVYIPLMDALDMEQSKIFVEGEVKNPGAYDYKPGLTALNACIMAGGFDTFAAPNRARIIRKSDGDVQVIKVNLKSVKKGKIPDVRLMPGDRVHVPETWL
jgi:polysaccharide export outer membrane protein